MLTIVGAIIVSGAVVGGYLMAGGHLGVLFQPAELVVIIGAALGSLVMSSPMPLIKGIIREVIGSLTKKDPTQQDYIDLLMLLFLIFKQAKQNLLGLEPHVENPEASDIFKQYPSVLKNHHAMHFICDTLKVQIATPLGPYELEELMDTDLNAAHQEEHQVPTVVNRIGDAMPGLGIVAAVLGVVITMGKLSQGKEVIGHSVAAALVGTFLGILVSYGYLQPLAAKIDSNLNNEGKYIEVIKVAILAFAKDSSPKVCVEFARRCIPPHIRPSFKQVDEATAGAGKKAA